MIACDVFMIVEVQDVDVVAHHPGVVGDGALGAQIQAMIIRQACRINPGVDRLPGIIVGEKTMIARLPVDVLQLDARGAVMFVLAREEGVLVGISAAGNVHAALSIGRELHEQGRAGVIVTVLCDSADKYLSEHFWDEPDL